MIDQDLQSTLNWSKERLQSGQEPPWAIETLRQLEKLIESIIAGRSTVITLEDLHEEARLLESDPQLTGYTAGPNIIQLRPNKLRVQLPM